MSRSFRTGLCALSSFAIASAAPCLAKLPPSLAFQANAEDAVARSCDAVAQAGPASGASKPAVAEDPLLDAWGSLLDGARRARTEGDHAGARAQISQAIERAVGELGGREDAPALELLAQMGKFAREAGDLRSAEKSHRRVLEVRSRVLPDEHPDLQKTRHSLGITIMELGDLEGARRLQEKVLEVYSRTLPEEHVNLQAARITLANTFCTLGDFRGARALHGKALEVLSRAFPEEYPLLQTARLNLAASLSMLGDLRGARALQEKALEVRSKTLPDEHPELQRARGGLASTLSQLGDLQGARTLQEKVLEVRSRTLPDEHGDLQVARGALAATLYKIGDLQSARALQERVLEVLSRTLPDGHPELLSSQGNLAATLYHLGDVQGARTLQERVLEASAKTLPDDHPTMQVRRECLAITLHNLGELERSQELFERILEVRSKTLPDEHPALETVRHNLAFTVARLAVERPVAGREGEIVRHRARQRNVELALARCRSGTSAASSALLQGSPREAEARFELLTQGLGFSLSMADGLGVFDPMLELDRACFVLSETLRGAALSSAALMRLAARSPRCAELRDEIERQSREIASLAQRGTTNEEFQAALARRESAQRELVALAKEPSGKDSPVLEVEVDQIARQLGHHDALVAYRRYRRTSLEVVEKETAAPDASRVVTHVERLCAFVLRRDIESDTTSPPRGMLTRVDLGSIEPLERTVREWRQDLGFASGRGVGVDARPAAGSLAESGKRIRRLAFDPLAELLAGATRVLVVPDDVLHLVPFDALPRGDSTEELLGDNLRIEMRATVSELLISRARIEGAESLLAVGDVAFDLPTHEAGTAKAASTDGHAHSDATPPSEASRTLPRVLRGGSFEGFVPLPATALEVEALAESFTERFRSGIVSILRGTEASRERLFELAPKERWIHVATHGWFATESIRSWQDEDPVDEQSGLGLRQAGEEQVKGMSPMLLCGLALAGANRPENEVGRAPGLVTADEISALDLTNCELAVLSACDTNVGERRAGQGVASLQKALQMAGARSVITSLWKVPDEATRELMTDFYRRLWVEKEPKWRALWEAKKGLREAKDESGRPRYSTRDWAAWVLTGEPE